jgi:hypothetical protein
MNMHDTDRYKRLYARLMCYLRLLCYLTGLDNYTYLRKNT